MGQLGGSGNRLCRGRQAQHAVVKHALAKAFNGLPVFVLLNFQVPQFPSHTLQLRQDIFDGDFGIILRGGRHRQGEGETGSQGKDDELLHDGVIVSNDPYL